MTNKAAGFVLVYFILSAILSACSVHVKPEHKRGGVIIIAPSEPPEIKPMPDKASIYMRGE
jgi:hypothetical protein